MESRVTDRLPARHIALGTISFAVCFALWGLISAFAPRFRAQFHLSATEGALLVAVPVLLGSLARIPMGMLADRLGGRSVFSALMILVAIPAALVPEAGSYPALLGVAFFLGLAGSSFSVGVGYVSRWTPASKQGTGLGIYGAGNIGQSAAVFLAPVLAGTALGLAGVYRAAAVLSVVWGVAFWLLARNAPSTAKPKALADMLRLLAQKRLSWVLSAFYFLTFGGFVAFSIYLPTLLREEFKLTETDAGLRVAGFVVLATAMRPIGGWLSDRIGGERVLGVVFAGLVPFAALLGWSSMVPFTVGALGCAALLGAGNGAVFKLVPQHFPGETGTVTGLVGAMGGLGGFFPPLVMGIFRDRLHILWPGFAMLAAVAAGMWALNRKVFIARADPRRPPATSDGLRAGVWASLFTLVLVAAIVVGSRNLENFDAALVVYTFAVVFATWGVTFHYYVWLQKPPTRVFWERGFQLVHELGLFRSLGLLARTAASHLIAQLFIRRRSRQRWWMHQLLFWGCLLGVAVTFPLVFGWLHFTARPDDQMTYVLNVFGFPTFGFPIHSVFAWLVFHALDIAAVMVLTGIALSLWRRMRDLGALAVQDFSRDLVPLIVLFAICVTGLALTVSTAWLRGSLFSFLAITHAATVVAGLLFLPFGKFFHIFQRPAQLGIKVYQRAGDAGVQARCGSCREAYASQMHIADLKKVLPELGFDYALPGAVASWQELCPRCKRVALARAQLRVKEESRG